MSLPVLLALVFSFDILDDHFLGRNNVVQNLIKIILILEPLPT